MKREKLSSIEIESLPTELTLTCDLQFKSSASHRSDPHTYKDPRSKVSRFER